MHRGFGNKTSWAWLVLLAALLATVGFAGCGGDDDDDDSSGADDGIDDDDDDDTGDDDSGDDDDDTSCGDEGETRCDGDVIQTCADGAWADTTDCAEQGPTGLSCVLNPDEGVHECAAASGPETLIDEVSDGDVEDTGEGAWWIDATAGGTEQAASNPWIYVSFNDDGGKVSLSKVDITDVQAQTSDAWTLAFKRHSIKINGGDFGGGAIGARKNNGPTLDDVRHYVDFGFEQDDYLDEDDNVIPDPIGGPATVLSDWYDYDITTHKLMPKTRVYVLQDNGSGAYAKFEILGYYREFDVTAETTAVAGWFEIAADWIDDAVAANNDDDTLIDASAGGSGNAPTNPPAFFAFAENGVVDGWPGESGDPEYQPDDPATWDLWFKRTDVSNTSAQAGGVLDLGVVDFEDVDAVPDTTPLIENPDLVVAFAGYTPALNLGLTYLVQGGDGIVYKLEAQDAVYAGESPFFYPTSITVRFQPVNGTGTETIFTADVDDAD
ncbi:hypothetical protein KDL45_08290, partial [bacterium]|nr:hypothetical protein [bacterium]